MGDDYELGVGEAAFYGPKLDFMAKDALGREFQVATIQLDFNQPEGFDLNCTNEGGASERIVMIHCAIMGSIDRFLSILIEHTAGKFPLWLSPVQVQLITVNATDEMLAYATGVASDMKGQGLRVEVDSSNESVGKKIRASELAKVPYAIVLGDKEKTSNKVTPRIRKDLVAGEPVEYSMADFIKTVAHEAKSRTSKSSL